MRKITIIMDDEPLPEGVRGVCTGEFKGEKEVYHMLIDSGLNDDEKEKTFLHECRHIFRGDFLKPGNVQEIEQRSHFGA